MDPILGGALIQGGASLLSSLFSKKQKKPQPQMITPQQMQYTGPSQIPAYAALFSQQPYDQASSPVYQQLLQQMGGTLPPELRAQILGQAQLEAQNAYDSANRNLTFDEDRAMRSASERMNKMGLLSSGAHGVTQGLLGEGYARQRGTLAANLQGQLGAASTNLMQQEFAQRQRTMELLQGIENQRQQASIQSRGQLFNLANAEAQGMNAANQFNAGAFNSAAAANASNQYSADQYAYGQNAAANGNLFNTLGQMGASYFGRQRTMRRTLR